jgi:glyoxylase-like metal-dependent hydrolase (beta-lactamase superfamily II)
VIEKVIDGVHWIRGQDSFLPDSHVYVIGLPDLKDYSLVDCGLMDKGGYKVDQLDKIGVSPNDVKRIIMTHTHLDHIGCLPEILEAIPHAEIWVHRVEANPLEAGESSIVYGNKMFESMLKAQFSMPEDLFKVNVDRKLEGGEDLSLGGIDFKVLHIPGHSAGHIGLFNEEHRMFLSGDTIYADGAIGRYDLESADPSALKDSLEMIAGLGVDILLPCHNRIVTGGAEEMVRMTVKQWAPYLS